MKNHIMLLLTILTASLCGTSIAMAQVSLQYGGVSQGMFGPRVIGRPNTGMEMTGMFGSRAIGRPMGFQPLNYSYLIQPTFEQFAPNTALQPYSLATPGYQAVIGPRYATAELQGEPTVAPAVPEETNGLPAAAPAAPNLRMPVGAEPAVQPAVAIPTGQRFRMQVGFTPHTRPQLNTFIRSEELSNHLTSIARNKGMLTGSDIDVYLSDEVAIVQGKVRSPGDRTLLANVLSLNPGVQQIDNRLVVQQSSSMR
jgi:hypothetical protein